MQKSIIKFDEDDCPPLTEADFKLMHPYRLTKSQRLKALEIENSASVTIGKKRPASLKKLTV